MRILLAICLLWLSLLSWAFSENELITLLQTPVNLSYWHRKGFYGKWKNPLPISSV